jgi:MFS family permease
MTASDKDYVREQREETKRAIAAMLIPIFFVIMFATCIIGTYHKPHPNHIKVGVVGPAALTAPLRASLTRAAGSSFTISSVSSLAEATHAVRNRDLNAGFVPTPDPKRMPAAVIVASGGGRLVATAAEQLAGAVAARQGARLVTRDVRPLTPGDEIGIGVFMFMVVCTICGYLAATLLFTVAPALEAKRRYPMIAAGSVIVPTIAYLIGGAGFGTYKGSFGTIVAFIGVGALYTFVIGLVTRLLQVLIGETALFLSLAIFVFLNIPSLGATYTGTMLPSFWRFVNHFWIGAETTNAERSLLYFGGLGVGTDLLRLLAWAGATVVLLALPVSRKLARQREPGAVRELRLARSA